MLLKDLTLNFYLDRMIPKGKMGFYFWFETPLCVLNTRCGHWIEQTSVKPFGYSIL